MLASYYYVASQKNCKQQNFARRIQQKNVWIKINASRLSYELGLCGETDSMETWEYYEKWTS